MRNLQFEQLAPHFRRIIIGELSIWWSYSTVIGFATPDNGRIVRRNEWGPTTGKHLNAIDGGGAAKLQRVTGTVFDAALARIDSRLEMIPLANMGIGIYQEST